jgi:signal transduction histidine kinase
MLIVAILLLFTIALNLGLGGLVFYRTGRKSYGFYFAMSVFGIALWALGDLLVVNGRTDQIVNVGAYIFYNGPLIIPYGILLFSLSFPANKKVPKLAIYPGLISILFWMGVLLYNPGFLVKSIHITHGLNVLQPKAQAFFVYSLHFSILFMATYIILIRKIKKSTRVQKSQISYTLVGTLIASILGMITNIVFPTVGIFGYIWLGPIFSLSFVVAVTMAIVRHRLFDIKLVIARSLAYILSLSILIVIYSLLITVLTQLIGGIGNGNYARYGTTIIFLSIAAVSYSPLKRYFDKLTNSIFYRDAYSSKDLLDELNNNVLLNVNVKPLLAGSSSIIKKYVKLRYCAFVLKKTDYEIQRIIGDSAIARSIEHDLMDISRMASHLHTRVIVTDDISEAHPDMYELLSKHEIGVLARITPDLKGPKEDIGYLLIGNKKSGNSFNSDDIASLRIISSELTIAIQNSLRFEEIQKFNQTLQAKVDESTSKLRRTNEKLKALDETKDDFISMASHQMRTPLTSIKGYLSMVLEEDAGTITPMQREMLGQAFFSSQRMVYLIADLLNVSRLKTGKFLIEASPVNLANMVEQELKQLEESAASRSLTFRFDKPYPFPDMMLDETKTRQVIMNFVDNAIYYTPAGGHIEVKLIDNPNSVELRVEDDGIGVAKDEQHHLFTKFYRAGNARKARPDGTGLGLYMAKKVIAGQNGSIIFESQEGKGSTFGFVFGKARLESTIGSSEVHKEPSAMAVRAHLTHNKK